jgi:hypothetical protein
MTYRYDVYQYKYKKYVRTGPEHFDAHHTRAAIFWSYYFCSLLSKIQIIEIAKS